MNLVKYISTFSLLVFASTIIAQNISEEALYAKLKAADSILFEESFNKCKTHHLDTMVAEDFEFYHDQGGVNQSKEEFIAVMRNGICRKDNSTKSRRALVEGSLKVFPLYNNGELYGALQNGEHKFFESYKGADETPGSIAKFSHLWLLIDNKWQVARVLSYDHKSQNN